jgi:hypothetical protein
LKKKKEKAILNLKRKTEAKGVINVQYEERER